MQVRAQNGVRKGPPPVLRPLISVRVPAKLESYQAVRGPRDAPHEAKSGQGPPGLRFLAVEQSTLKL